MKVQFHPAAASEHLDSVAFYENRLAGLGADYLAEFDTTLAQVCNAPIGFLLDTTPDIRIAQLKRFPFNLLFRPGASVSPVLAVAHQRRRPRYWLGRIAVANDES